METRNETHNHLLLLITRTLARSAHVVLAASWLTLLFLFPLLFLSLSPGIPRTLQYITTTTRRISPLHPGPTDCDSNNNVSPMRETKIGPRLYQ